jgi:D-alanyl-D-alanine carboxypeptidase
MKKNSAILILVLFCLVLTAGCARREKTSAPAPTPVSTPVPEATPTPPPTPEPTPESRAIELPPLPDVNINSWEFLYAGPHLGVGRYHPHVANVENQYMDERCAEATIAFLNAAREQGFEVYMCTAYRNWEYTTFWYEEAMRTYGKFDDEFCHFLPGSSYEAAKHGFAAGCSEHSTGLAFDITDESYYWADVNYSNIHDETVAGTPVCKWMNEHCAEYGFIVRYPESKKEVYGMACYPGHYRYVGREAAKYIMDNDLCLEEFLALYGKTIRGVNYVNEYVVRDK